MTFLNKVFFAVVVAVSTCSLIFAMGPGLPVRGAVGISMLPDEMISKNIYNSTDCCGVCREQLERDPRNPVIAIHCDKIRNLYHSYHANCIKGWWDHQALAASELSCPLCSRNTNFKIPGSVELCSLLSESFNVFLPVFFLVMFVFVYLIASDQGFILGSCSPLYDFASASGDKNLMSRAVIINAETKDDLLALSKKFIPWIIMINVAAIGRAAWKVRSFLNSRKLSEVFKTGGILRFN